MPSRKAVRHTRVAAICSMPLEARNANLHVTTVADGGRHSRGRRVSPVVSLVQEVNSTTIGCNEPCKGPFKFIRYTHSCKRRRYKIAIRFTFKTPGLPRQCVLHEAVRA